MNYLDNLHVSQLIENGDIFQKNQHTGLRKPFPNEIGQQITTYVKQDTNIRIESTSIINTDSIIAQNSEILGQIDGKDIYNEWPISKETAIKNYGSDIVDNLTHHFTLHKKKATVKAIMLTQEIMNILEVDGNILNISVTWSDKPMQAHIGDYLTNGGYSISAHDMKAYDKISNTKNQ